MKILARIVIVLAVFLGGLYAGQSFVFEPKNALDESCFLETKSDVRQIGLMLDFGDGEIISFNNIEFIENENVFDLLKRITQNNEVELIYQDHGGNLGVMIESIGGRKNDFSADKY